MKNSTLWMIAGIFSLLGGFFALANPLAASITVDLLAAWVFLVVGALQLYAAFQAEGFKNKIWPIIGGLAGIFVGISLIAHPLAGVVSLTLVVGVMFFVAGLTKMMVSFSLTGTGFFWSVMISGILSLLLGIMTLSNFPQSAVVILGTLLAVELIFDGVALISLSIWRKSEAGDAEA